MAEFNVLIKIPKDLQFDVLAIIPGIHRGIVAAARHDYGNMGAEAQVDYMDLGLKVDTGEKYDKDEYLRKLRQRIADVGFPDVQVEEAS